MGKVQQSLFGGQDLGAKPSYFGPQDIGYFAPAPKGLGMLSDNEKRLVAIGVIGIVGWLMFGDKIKKGFKKNPPRLWSYRDSPSKGRVAGKGPKTAAGFRKKFNALRRTAVNSRDLANLRTAGYSLERLRRQARLRGHKNLALDITDTLAVLRRRIRRIKKVHERKLNP
jgi:hypothetical protein